MKTTLNSLSLIFFVFVSSTFIYQHNAAADTRTYKTKEKDIGPSAIIMLGGGNIAGSAKLSASSGDKKAIETIRDENLKTAFQFAKSDKIKEISFQFNNEVRVKEIILRGNSLYNARFSLKILGRFKDEEKHTWFNYELPIIASDSFIFALQAGMVIKEIILKEKVKLSEELYRIGEIQIFEWPLYTSDSQLANFYYLYFFTMGDMERIVEIIRILAERLDEVMELLREWAEGHHEQRAARPEEIEMQIDMANVRFVDSLLPSNGYISGGQLYAIPVYVINNGDGMLEGNYVLEIIRTDIIGDFYREEDRDNIRIQNATREFIIEEAVEPHSNVVYTIYLGTGSHNLRRDGLFLHIELRDNQGQSMCTLRTRIPAEEF